MQALAPRGSVDVQLSLPFWGALRAWLGSLVEDVPPDLEHCEFDCRRSDCQVGDWVTCEHRLAGRRAETTKADED